MILNGGKETEKSTNPGIMYLILDYYATSQGGRGHWAVSYSLAQQSWELLLNFDWLFHLVECLNIAVPNCNLKKG